MRPVCWMTRMSRALLIRRFSRHSVVGTIMAVWPPDWMPSMSALRRAPGRRPAPRALDPRPLLSFLLIVGLLIWGGVVAVRARRPLYAGYGGAGTGTMPQDELPPAFVGALIHGHAGDQEVRATILQMSTEGALDIEPVDDRSVQIRLRDQALLRQTWELTTWESLAGVADAQRIVSAPALERAAKEWNTIADIIDAELRQRGYRTPATSSTTPSLSPRRSRERL